MIQFCQTHFVTIFISAAFLAFVYFLWSEFSDIENKM